MGEIIKTSEKWHIREVDSVLVDEDWGDGGFPLHRDIRTVGDILRIGEAGLSMRFREVNPETWRWLISELEGLR